MAAATVSNQKLRPWTTGRWTELLTMKVAGRQLILKAATAPTAAATPTAAAATPTTAAAAAGRTIHQSAR